MRFLRNRAWLAAGVVGACAGVWAWGFSADAAQGTGPAADPVFSRAVILPVMEHMADVQLATPAYRGGNPPVDWVAGAFYVGLARLAHESASPRFQEAELRIANRYDWRFQFARPHTSVAHADDECIGQMYIDLSVSLKDPGKLDGLREQLDGVVAGFENPTDATRRAWDNNLERDGASLPWWWCDAFFMAPPVFTRLSVVTGDRKYIDAMDKQWWRTTERLYDEQEHLFYRDARFLTQKTPNGKKVFWGRGNGWVVAGLANVLTSMPKDYPTRAKYEALFKEMAGKVATLQQEDGLWRGSLLDPEAAAYPETSGTGFFCYALAWGVNNGLLDRKTFQPVVDRAWVALTKRLRSDGLIGWVQRIGDSPQSAEADSTQPYAVGAFLLAGAEVMKVHGE